MLLRYRNFTHGLGEPAFTISRKTVFNDARVGIGYVETWDINGMLQAPTQAALNARILALEAAYSVNGGDLTVLLTSGGASAHAILSANTLGGVRVVAPPSYPVGSGGEFTTYRSFTVSLEAEVPYAPAAKWLVSFEETLSFVGDGGPEYGYLYPLQDKPIKQKLRAYTSCRATQSGRAVGYGEYPDVLVIAPPLWPNAEMRHLRSVLPVSPKRHGPKSNASFTDYPVTWKYEFESADPLRGAPHKWKG